MTSFDKINEISNQCMRNIEAIMNDSKNIIKNFKVQQADIMKNILVSSDGGSLDQQFRQFQNELSRREQEQYDQINGKIVNELDTMKKLILQELSTPSVSMPNSYSPGDVDPSFNMNNLSEGNKSNDLGLEFNDAIQKNIKPSEAGIDSQLQKEIDGINNPRANSFSSVNNLASAGALPSIDNLQSSNDLTKSLDDLDGNMLNQQINSAVNSNGNSNPNPSNSANDIPVETKELDEWISEIKNLI